VRQEGCRFEETAWSIVSCAIAAGELRVDGFVESPAVLMRSRIARLRGLEALGIPLAIELPSMGARAWDHAALLSGWRADA
jgi:choline dehydrogenase-like flavoprotein